MSVWEHRLLLVMALVVGLWQLCQNAAMVVQILFATRELGLNERQVGLCYIGLGVSMTIHWFSDFAAGAILGTIIGLVVGRSFSPERVNSTPARL